MSLLKLNSKYCKLSPEQRLYNIDQPIIGLTGGIATGKSTASSIMKSMGASIIDADGLVKRIYQSDDTKKLVKELAPESIFNSEIDFKKLRERFFSDSTVKSRLETHIYSHMPQKFKEAIEKLPKKSLIIYDVPLLFEKSIDKLVDVSVLIYAPKEVQVTRLVKRDGIDPKLAQTILAKQMPIEDKKKLAQFTIENTSDIKYLDNKVREFLGAVSSKL